MKYDVKMLCEKCKSEQTMNKEKSNENWKIYDCTVKCVCGGKFKPITVEVEYKHKRI